MPSSVDVTIHAYVDGDLAGGDKDGDAEAGHGDYGGWLVKVVVISTTGDMGEQLCDGGEGGCTGGAQKLMVDTW